jgi:uncharacterized membrane protein YfhO
VESRFEKSANRIKNSIDSSKKAFFASYIALFCFFMLLFSFGYLLYGKSFIWTVDGLEQQYMFFIMQGEWLRELLTNIFVEHTFVIPMWSDSIGYGADYVYSLGNTLGNPINWISVFATSETAGFWLNLTVPITLFLAGLSFLGYCLKKEFDRSASLIGCMIYLFGGYTIIVSSQIYMIYPLVLAPLVLWGVDKIFDKESPVLFVAAMALCFFCSVSLAYTMCLSLLVYCLVKVFNLEERTTFKSFFAWVVKILMAILLAALIAGVMFYPNAASLLGQGRLGLDRYQSATYSFSYYIKLLEGFISPSTVGEDCMYGFAPIALVAVFALFLTRKLELPKRTKRILRTLFVLMTLFLCIPIAGRIFNGMAYASNRWVWAYCLLVSLIVTVVLPSLANALKGEGKKVFYAASVYGIVCMLLLAWYSGKTFYAMLSILFAVIVVCYVFREKPALLNVGVTCSVAVSCVFVSYQYAHGNKDTHVGIGKAYEYAVEDDASSLVMGLDDHAEQRYDNAKVHFWRNGNWATGTLGCTFYNSLYNSAIDDYHTSLGLATSSMNFSYATLNSRTTMEALAGTKYFLTLTHDDDLLPPLYKTVVARGEVAGGDYSVYETEEVLPLAFFYDSSISERKYRSMDLMQRQDALTQSVVLGNNGAEDVDVKSYTANIASNISLTQDGDESLPVKDDLSESDKAKSAQIDGNTITITQPNTVLYLNGRIPGGMEAYFVCEGMNYSPLASSSNEGEGGVRASLKTLLSDIKASDSKECKIIVYGNNASQEIWFMNNKHHLYGGKDDWAVNTGYSDSSRSSIALQFSDPGIYTFDSLGLYATDTSCIEKDIEHLSSNSASDIEKAENSYSCQTSRNEEGWLYFRVPYSEGWTACVDGEKTDIEKANLGFMAVRVPSGDHSIQITYETPNLREGAFVSCFGIAIALVILCCRMRKNKMNTSH